MFDIKCKREGCLYNKNQNCNCNNCNTKNSLKREYCYMCGTYLDVEIEKTPESIKNKYCTQCGTLIKCGWKYCNNCGSEIE